MRKVRVVRDNFATDERFAKEIENARIDELVRPGSRSEFLSLVTPPPAPPKVWALFSFLKEHISFIGTESGVAPRESRSGLAKLLERGGWDYEVCRPIVEDFENRMWKQH